MPGLNVTPSKGAKQPVVLLGDYLPIVRRRWWIVVAVTVTALVASFVFSRLQTPVYRASASLTVSPSRMDYGQTLVIENLIRQYARELQTERLAEQVNDILKLDLPIPRLREKMKASPVMDDLTLQLQVDDTDPNRARDIVFEWSREFVKFHQNRMASVDPRDRIEVNLLDRPPPAELNWPKRTQIMLAAGVLGLLAGVLLVLALEYVDPTVATADRRGAGTRPRRADGNAETPADPIGARSGPRLE